MSNKSDWQFVADKTLETYHAGIRAGDKVRVVKEILVKDEHGKIIDIHAAGEIWTILSGNHNEPDVIWLRRPDGERHTWDLSSPSWSVHFELLADPGDTH